MGIKNAFKRKRNYNKKMRNVLVNLDSSYHPTFP